jgi:hypothetical protein
MHGTVTLTVIGDIAPGNGFTVVMGVQRAYAPLLWRRG